MNKISVTSKFALLCDQLYPDDVVTIYDSIYDMALVTGESSIGIFVFGEHEWVFVAEFTRPSIQSALHQFKVIKENRHPDIYSHMDEEHPYFECDVLDRIYYDGAVPF